MTLIPKLTTKVHAMTDNTNYSPNHINTKVPVDHPNDEEIHHIMIEAIIKMFHGLTDYSVTILISKCNWNDDTEIYNGEGILATIHSTIVKALIEDQVKGIQVHSHHAILKDPIM